MFGSRESMESVEDIDDIVDINALSDVINSDGIPTALIVTNVDPSIFSEAEAQAAFESTFRDVDRDVTFIYMRNIKRARLQFSSPCFAAVARHRFDNVVICGQTVRCHLVQVRSVDDKNVLLPPKPQRVFLISPPASPPVGWEPLPDVEPVINYDLLRAIEGLNTAEQDIEVLPPSDSGPSIVVSLCDDVGGLKERKQST